MQAKTIDEVIVALDDILDWAIANNSRLGYFPALYRHVTVRVRDGIAAGEFDDNARMEKLDVVFANRYLAAFDAHRAGRQPTLSWQLAFMTAEKFWPIVLQHLMMGINAHINLDLGIAAAEIAPGNKIDSLKGDFERINAILASMVNNVQDSLATIWPMLKVLDWFAGRLDERIADGAIRRAREHAWGVAKRMAELDATERDNAITKLDQNVAVFGDQAMRPGCLLRFVNAFVRLGEMRTAAGIIRVLREDAPQTLAFMPVK